MRNEPMTEAISTLREAHHIADLIGKPSEEDKGALHFEYEAAFRGVSRLILNAVMTLEEELPRGNNE